MAKSHIQILKFLIYRKCSSCHRIHYPRFQSFFFFLPFAFFFFHVIFLETRKGRGGEKKMDPRKKADSFLQSHSQLIIQSKHQLSPIIYLYWSSESAFYRSPSTRVSFNFHNWYSSVNVVYKYMLLQFYYIPLFSPQGNY